MAGEGIMNVVVAVSNVVARAAVHRVVAEGVESGGTLGTRERAGVLVHREVEVIDQREGETWKEVAGGTLRNAAAPGETRELYRARSGGRRGSAAMGSGERARRHVPRKGPQMSVAVAETGFVVWPQGTAEGRWARNHRNASGS